MKLLRIGEQPGPPPPPAWPAASPSSPSTNPYDPIQHVDGRVVTHEVIRVGVAGFERLLRKRDEGVRPVLPLEVRLSASVEVVPDRGTR